MNCIIYIKPWKFFTFFKNVEPLVLNCHYCYWPQYWDSAGRYLVTPISKDTVLLNAPPQSWWHGEAPYSLFPCVRCISPENLLFRDAFPNPETTLQPHTPSHPPPQHTFIFFMAHFISSISCSFICSLFIAHHPRLKSKLYDNRIFSVAFITASKA